MVNHSSMPIHSPIFSSFGLKMRPTRKIRSMRTARVVLPGLLHSGLTWEICPFFLCQTCQTSYTILLHPHVWVSYQT